MFVIELRHSEYRPLSMVEKTALEALTGTPHARPFAAGEPMVVWLTLEAGERVPPHTHPDRQIVLFLRSGLLDIDLDEKTHRVESGEVLRFDGKHEVSPLAVEDSEALLVLAERTE